MKILILSTFPAFPPAHGGQHRLYNIIKQYEDAGHEVYSAGVLGSPVYLKTKNFLSYPGMHVLTKYIKNPFLMDDWAIGELFWDNKEYFNSLSKLIDVVPDAIEVEHPWLFKFAYRYIQKNNLQNKTKLIYSSYNVESDLKYEILKSYMTKKEAENGRDLVLEAELFAINHADGVICVSQADLDWTKQYTKKPCILAPNGVTERYVTLEGIKKANAITHHQKFALYCASGHPPNVHGFFDIFKGGIGCFPPEVKLVVAGGASQAIQLDSRFTKVAGLASCYISAGEIDEECLQGLINNAHAIIVPITQGGGTNLKTAEAIWSGRFVIITQKGMRGFEDFSNDRGIFVSPTSADFLNNLRVALESESLKLTDVDYQKRKSVLMKSTLQPIIKFIETL